ncbi:MAG: DUF5666 domain-containing protein [Gammaproteobacteria bacterium]|nr:DUF5666 domain-containing protein [Gammaproteobacteria bacterium]
MNKFFRLNQSRKLATALVCSLMVSCGGDVIVAGIGGTGITSGEITAFGSVYVNGVKFNTDSAQFEVDGEIYNSQPEAVSAGLTEGMVARIYGSTDANGSTGTASRVVYDNEIEGPVNNPLDLGGGQMSFDIFGQTIIVDEISTRLKGTSFPLVQDQLVEVSGFISFNSSVRATFVEGKGVLSASATSPSQVELKGTVDGFVNQDSSFSVNGLTIDMSANPIINTSSGTLANGDFIEVSGTYYQNAEAILANEIEDEDSGFGSDVGEISLQGIVSNSNGLGKFSIGSQTVDAGNAILYPSNSIIEDGVKVEVDGSIVGGILFADEVELREGSIELKAEVAFIGPGDNQFQLQYIDGVIIVNTDDQTRLEDDALGDITLADLTDADYVIVKAIEVDGSVIATNVKRRELEDTEIKGSVEDFIPNASIKILGITHTVDATTNYGLSDASTFFGLLEIGNIVKIRDNASPEPPDGIAEEIGFGG